MRLVQCPICRGRFRCARTCPTWAGAAARREADRERFYSHVAPPNAKGCRLWLLAPAEDGYGWFTLGRRKVRAHVAALILNGVAIAEGQEGCHRCDVPMCVELSHVFPCTHAENIADRDAKGRTMRGEAHHLTRLSDDDVRAIRRSLNPVSTLAAMYGLDVKTVRRIRNHETWKHVS